MPLQLYELSEIVLTEIDLQQHLTEPRASGVGDCRVSTYVVTHPGHFLTPCCFLSTGSSI